MPGTFANDVIAITRNSAASGRWANGVTVAHNHLAYKTRWGANWLASLTGNQFTHRSEANPSHSHTSGYLDTIAYGEGVFVTPLDGGIFSYQSSIGTTPLSWMAYTDWHGNAAEAQRWGNSFETAYAQLSLVEGGDGNDDIRVYDGGYTLRGGNGNDYLMATGTQGYHQIEYVTWGGAKWTARREGNTFVHTSIDGRTHRDTIINYISSGQNWTAKLDGNTFIHALNGDFNAASHSGDAIFYETWQGVGQWANTQDNVFMLHSSQPVQGNTFSGDAGNDTIQGGKGVDTAEFSGNFLDYDFSESNGKITVADRRGIDGIDTLSSIETLHFKGNNSTYNIVTSVDSIFQATNNQPYIILGQDTNDFLTGGGGNDLINGGGGDDEARYSGQWSDYDITRQSNGDIKIHDRRNIDGTDLLSNIEALRFGPEEDTIELSRLGIKQETYELVVNNFTNFAREGAPPVFLYGRAKNSIIRGNHAHEWIHIEGDGTHDIDGGDNIDTLFLKGDANNYTFELNGDGSLFANDDTQPGKKINKVSNVEYLNFSTGDNTYKLLIGDDGQDTFQAEHGIRRIDPGLSKVVKSTYHYMMFGGAGNDDMRSVRGIYSHIANNQLFGGTGNDRLIAGVGEDKLLGGDGDDYLLSTTSDNGNTTLSGGYGADRFAFGLLTEGIDIITDFSQAQGDKIEIDQLGFGATSKDQFSFDTSTGALSFNQKHFATLQNVSIGGFSTSNDIVFV